MSTTPNLIVAYYPTSGDTYLTDMQSVIVSDTSKYGPRISQGAWVVGYNGGSDPFLGQLAVWMDFPPLGTSDGATLARPSADGRPVPGALGLPNSSVDIGPGLGPLQWFLLLGVVAPSVGARLWGVVQGLLARVRAAGHTRSLPRSGRPIRRPQARPGAPSP
ncbi:MAG: hypothetical protein ACYDGR_15070 [Candidatus Dormibacteria bacterium]